MPIVPSPALQDPSPELQAILQWLNFQVTTFDLEALEEMLTEDFVYQILPTSMAEHPLDKAASLRRAGAYFHGMFKHIKVWYKLLRHFLPSHSYLS